MGSWTKFSGGPTPAAQFIATHFQATSRNQGSFSKQEREPWERDCEFFQPHPQGLLNLQYGYRRHIGKGEDPGDEVGVFQNYPLNSHWCSIDRRLRSFFQ